MNKNFNINTFFKDPSNRQKYFRLFESFYFDYQEADNKYRLTAILLCASEFLPLFIMGEDAWGKFTSSLFTNEQILWIYVLVPATIAGIYYLFFNSRFTSECVEKYLPIFRNIEDEEFRNFMIKNANNIRSIYNSQPYRSENTFSSFPEYIAKVMKNKL